MWFSDRKTTGGNVASLKHTTQYQLPLTVIAAPLITLSATQPTLTLFEGMDVGGAVCWAVGSRSTAWMILPVCAHWYRRNSIAAGLAASVHSKTHDLSGCLVDRTIMSMSAQGSCLYCKLYASTMLSQCVLWMPSVACWEYDQH